MTDLNEFIVAAYTKTCKRHGMKYNIIVGCIGCTVDKMKLLGFSGKGE